MNLFNFGIQTLSYGILEILYSFASIIPKVAYLLANSFLGLLDVFQLWFRKLAGLDVYYVDGEAQTGDIVYQFLRGILTNEYPALNNVFWGLIILGIILLFLSTIVSIIRSEYAAEKGDNSKGKIIGQSFKSLIYFAIVPIICLFGVFLSNVVLVAVDKATQVSSGSSTILNTSLLEPYTVVYNDGVSGGTETTAESVTTYSGYNIFGFYCTGSTTSTFSGMIFKVCAYDANRVRNTENLAITGNDGNTYNGFFELLQNDLATNFNGLFKDDGNDPNVVALYIDTAFADCVQVKYPAVLDYSETYIQNYSAPELDPFARAQQGINNQIINRFNVTTVWYYYDLWMFNFVLAFGAGVIMVTIFINIIFGLIKRMIELIVLFLISAPLIALFPLDNGKSYNTWRKSFIDKTLLIFSAVAGINIVFLVIPYLQEISFFNFEFLDMLVATIISIVALNSVKGFIKMFNVMIVGKDEADLASQGGDVAKDAGGTIAKAGKMAALALGAPAVAGAMAGKVAMKGAGQGIKGLSKVGGAIKKQATAQKRWSKDFTQHEMEMDTKEEGASVTKNLNIEDAKSQYDQEINRIDGHKSHYEREAPMHFNSAEREEYNSNTYENADGNTIYYTKDEKLKHQQSMIENKAKEKMDEYKLEAKRKYDDRVSQIKDNYDNKMQEILNERASKSPNLSDYQVHMPPKKDIAKGIAKGVGSGLGYTAQTMLSRPTQMMKDLGSSAKGSILGNNFNSGLGADFIKTMGKTGSSSYQNKK